MRVAAYERYGPPEVVAIVEQPDPSSGAGEVRIRVHAVSIGSSDSAARSGTPWFARLAFGLRAPRKAVLGSDFAGVVDATGPGVTRFAVGDRVFGATGAASGAHAELLVVAESSAIVPLPDSVGMTDAAAICDGALTALPFLRDGGHVRAGDRVLINGASGSVGAAAVQLAKHLGAHVTAVCGPAHLGLVAALGADHVVDRTRDDVTRGDAVFDVFFDAVGKSTFRRARRVLAPGGVYLTTVPSWAIMFQQLTSRLGHRRATIMFTGLRKDALKVPDLEHLAALAATGALRPPIEREVPLEQVADGYRLVDAGHKAGSVILRLASEGADAAEAATEPESTHAASAQPETRSGE